MPYKINDAIAYFYDDFINWSASGSSGYNASGFLGGSAGANSSAGQTSNQQGIIGGYINAVTAKYCCGYNSGYNGFYNGTSQTWQWRICFMTPSILSGANCRYTFYIGSFGWNGTVPCYGPSLSYCDNVNSGNWVMNVSAGTTISTSVNSTIGVGAASSWHVLIMTATAQTVTFTLDGTVMGTVTDTGLMNTAGAANWSGMNMVPSIGVNCTSYTSGVPQFVYDAGDCLITGLTR